MATPYLIAVSLARAFVAGEISADTLRRRGSLMLGRNPKWLGQLATRCAQQFASRKRPRLEFVTEFILADAGFHAACDKYEIELPGLLSTRPEMFPSANLGPYWSVPRLRTVGELAEWLQVPCSQLEWFADLRHWESKTDLERLRHYRYRWVGSGAGRVRLIEAPKPRLKAIQRLLLHEVLCRIPPHEVAHGFCRGRSIKSYVANHVGQSVVFKMDLRNFFPSIRFARIVGLFMLAGFPETVSRFLAGLCCNTVPDETLKGCPLSGAWGQEACELYRQPHLPQGAPTSPYLANLCAYRLDCRLTGLAQCAGANYSRYADDMLFSGGVEFLQGIKRFHIYAASIILEEGFQINTRKTRCMRRSVRQQAAGIILNEHPNTPRTAMDVLKATLHNCCRFGPRSQNRPGHADFRAHLSGRIGFVEMINPQRGEKLRKLFEQIDWERE